MNNRKFFETIQVVENAKDAGHVVAEYTDAAITRVAEVAAKSFGGMAVIEYKFIVFCLGFLAYTAACPFRCGKGNTGIFSYFFCDGITFSGGLGAFSTFRAAKSKSVAIEGVCSAGVAVVLIEWFLHFALGTDFGRDRRIQGVLLFGGRVLGLVSMLAVVIVFGSAESHRYVMRGVGECSP